MREPPRDGWRRLVPEAGLREQPTRDAIPTCWVEASSIRETLAALKPHFPMLYDLTAIDERRRTGRDDQPPSDFTVVYHLQSPQRNEELRLKAALRGEAPSLPSVTGLWHNAEWYERETWEMFGIGFDGHPRLRHLLMPPTWKGHPLRKEHVARATELGRFELTEERRAGEEEASRFKPEEWGMESGREGRDYLFLNLGPNHPSVHGVFRILLQLDGEVIVDAAPDIGFHHRGAEKMAERQSWHTYIPYTDRVDYLGGTLNNLPYLMAVEKLAGIEVPPRAQVIRVMLAELFRIASHLVFYGTFAQDLGQLSPVFYMFTDRERLFGIVEAITGARMHPGWYRIGGVAQELPKGWDRLVRDFLRYLPPRLDEYERLVLRNRIVKRRTQGIGAYSAPEAIEWGVTGPGLRAAGLDFDLRKSRPYGGYERFEFDVPIALHGDSYDRCLVRAEEMRQSLRIVAQCLEEMPGGPYKADHPCVVPPLKEYTLRDIETLIGHFLGVSWGPVIPRGEAAASAEGARGQTTYYLVSDGSISPYRARIRAPSFAHLQMIPALCRGLMVADLIAILGSIDFVMGDVDR